MSKDLISCITPTTVERRWCLPLAIECFQRQTWSNKELVILFSGPGFVRDLVPVDDHVRLIEVAGHPSLGDKHNLACMHANGRWITKWDDDDYHVPWFLENELAKCRPNIELIGHRRVIVHELLGTERTFVFDGTRLPYWVAGNSMLFRRSLWFRFPFPDRDSGVDTVWTERVLRQGSMVSLTPYHVELHNALLLTLPAGAVVMEWGQKTGRKNWNPCPPEYIEALPKTDARNQIDNLFSDLETITDRYKQARDGKL